jgi:hypothetical protein
MSVLSLSLRVHDAVYKATGGRIGHRVLGVPTLMLRTTGRRSGQPRTTSLVYATEKQTARPIPVVALTPEQPLA